MECEHCGSEIAPSQQAQPGEDHRGAVVLCDGCEEYLLRKARLDGWDIETDVSLLME